LNDAVDGDGDDGLNSTRIARLYTKVTQLTQKRIRSLEDIKIDCPRLLIIATGGACRMSLEVDKGAQPLPSHAVTAAAAVVIATRYRRGLSADLPRR